MIDRRLVRFAHAAAGGVALLTISAFQTSTITVELFGDGASIAAVKRTIVLSMPLLVLALAGAGLSGMALSRGRPHGLAARKLARMKIAAANGVVVLVPAAIYLAWKASDQSFDTAFQAVQAVEIVAGLVNLALIGLNLRDGLRMARGRAAAEASYKSVPCRITEAMLK